MNFALNRAVASTLIREDPFECERETMCRLMSGVLTGGWVLHGIEKKKRETMIQMDIVSCWLLVLREATVSFRMVDANSRCRFKNWKKLPGAPSRWGPWMDEIGMRGFTLSSWPWEYHSVPRESRDERWIPVIERVDEFLMDKTSTFSDPTYLDPFFVRLVGFLQNSGGSNFLLHSKKWLFSFGLLGTFISCWRVDGIILNACLESLFDFLLFLFSFFSVEKIGT